MIGKGIPDHLSESDLDVSKDSDKREQNGFERKSRIKFEQKDDKLSKMSDVSSVSAVAEKS